MHRAAVARGVALVTFTSPTRASTFVRRSADACGEARGVRRSARGAPSKGGSLWSTQQSRQGAIYRSASSVRAGTSATEGACSPNPTARAAVPGTRHSLFHRCPPLCTGLTRVEFRTDAAHSRSDRQETRRAGGRAANARGHERAGERH